LVTTVSTLAHAQQESLDEFAQAVVPAARTSTQGAGGLAHGIATARDLFAQGYGPERSKSFLVNLSVAAKLSLDNFKSALEKGAPKVNATDAASVGKFKWFLDTYYAQRQVLLLAIESFGSIVPYKIGDILSGCDVVVPSALADALLTAEALQLNEYGGQSFDTFAPCERCW
jgi:hypothetical protein